jgi:predicted ATP-dependent endonuclease of OLD family
LIDHNIDFEVEKTTEITYFVNDIYWKIGLGYIESNNEFKEDIPKIAAISRYGNGAFDSKNETLLLAFLNYFSTIPDHLLTNENDQDTQTRESKREGNKKHLGDLFKEAISKLGVSNPIYISAERMLISSIGDSLFGLMKNDVSIAKSLKEFGSLFETARRNLKSFEMLFLKAKYEYSDKNNFLTLSNGLKVKLEKTSSGFQSLVPLMVVVEYFANYDRLIDNFFIIEEPELNLYPSMQKSLMEFIVGKINLSKDKLIITTHSPYTLTTIDNLIQAKNAFELHPELKDEIRNTVPENLWVDFKKVSCYYFEEGFCRSTLDFETQSIGSSNIDDVSISLGETFDKLMDLKYHE